MVKKTHLDTSIFIVNLIPLAVRTVHTFVVEFRLGLGSIAHQIVLTLTGVGATGAHRLGMVIAGRLRRVQTVLMAAET